MEYDVAYLGYIRPLGDLLYMNNQNTSYDIRGQKAVACFLAPLHSSNYLKDFLYPFHRDGYHISHGGGYKKGVNPAGGFHQRCHRGLSTLLGTSDRPSNPPG